MKNISANPGLYLHIPFCDTKCGYCDFYSITNNTFRAEFLPALVKEISQYAKHPFQSSAYDTIYLGGGTPSLLATAELDQLFDTIYRHFSISENCEITIEVNPGTIDEEKLNYYKSIGINRLSIGIQSFSNDELKLLGRIHNSKQAIETYKKARRAGIDNISIDLIYALPDQSLSTWLSTLNKGLDLAPDHISAYNLTYEEGTPFYRQLTKGRLSKQTEEREEQFYNHTIERMQESGFFHYEISSYARSESRFSRHNYKYWTHTNYLSFGPSAHSYWNGQRWRNIRSISKYIHGINSGMDIIDFRESIEEDTMIFEKIMLGLRTADGIDLDKFSKSFTLSFMDLHKNLNTNLIENGFAVVENGYFKLTHKGMLVCDEILPRFVAN